MGGDGGTISSNRTYLRGTGKACHTADHPSNALKRSKIEDAERAQMVLSTCAVSQAQLHFSPAKKEGGGAGGEGSVSKADIVACPYGKLYRHETVLEALLQRSQTGGGDDGKTSLLGSHIRGMKDLHPARFHVVSSDGKYVAACPITGSEIASGNVPCFLIVRTKSKDKKQTDEEDEVARNPNVLSERAIKEMGVQGLQAEYGPFEEKDMIRLAPPARTGGIFEEIQRKWEATMEEERIAKLKKKKEKKRKRGVDENPKKSHHPTPSSAKPSEIRPSTSNRSNGGRGGNPMTAKSAVDEARSTVQLAVAQNPVLSNLFGAGKKDHRTEKKRNIDLFTRNC